MVRPKKEKAQEASFRLQTIREFANASKAAVVLVTPGHEIGFMNSAAESTWGKCVGKPCFEVLQGGQEPCPDCPIEGILKSKSLIRMQRRVLTNAGWADREILYMFIKGPVSGEPYMAMVSDDLQEREALVEEARRARELSNALLESMNALAIGFDRHGAISFFNRAAEEISGYSEAEIKAGNGIKLLVPREYQVTAEEYFRSSPEQPRSTEAVLIPILTRAGSRRMISWTYSPLVVEGGRVEGAIALGQDVTERFARRRQAERLAEELQVVNTVLARAGSSSDVDEMLKAALETVLKMPGFRCGAAYRLEQGGREGYRVALEGFRKAEPAKVLGEAEGLFPTTTVLGKNIQIVGSRESGIHPDIKIALEAEGLQSAIGVPVFAEGQPVGMLLLGHEHQPDKAAAGLEILKGVADALELSVENARLSSRAEERAREATALLRVAQGLTGTLDLNSALVKVTAEASELLGADLCDIWIYDEGRNVLQMAAGDDWSAADKKVDYIPFTTGGAMFEARRTLKSVIVDDAELDPRIPDYVVEERGIKSTLIVPLVMRGSFVGALTLDMVSRRRRFTEREAELMESFARQASIAIRNAYLVDELRESEERYRALAESSLFGMMILDGREILYANDRLFEITGYERSEIRTMQDVLKAIVPEERERVAELAEKFVETGETRPYFEVPIRHKDGSVLRFQAFSNVVTLGSRPVIMATIMDVTQTYMAEEALRVSEERYRALVESSRDSILITDPRGKVLFANDACVRLLGVPPEEILGQNIYTVVHPSERRQVVERFYRGWETGKGVARYPIRVVVGGEERFFEATTAVMGEPGPEANAMVIVSDVTERERAQRLLAESEGRYRTIVESSHDVIIMGNRGGEILYVNPAVRDLFGYDPEEVRGRYLFEFIHPDDRERAAKDFVNDWRTGRTIPNYPLRVIDAGERVHNIETTSGLVGWPSEDAVQVYVMRDVTERKQREAERELQARVEEAVAPIATRFVDPQDVYEAISETLESVGELLDLRRAFYVEVPERGSPAAAVIQWVQGEQESKVDGLQDVEPERLAWWLEAFSTRSEVSYDSSEDIPRGGRNPIMIGETATAIAAAPVVVKDQVIGAIGFNSEEVPHSWSPHELNLLRDICNTVSRALERRQWVEQLGRSEKFRTRITEGIGEGLLVLNNGVITWVNKQVSEILGYHQEELVGRDMKFLLPESTLPGEMAAGMVEPVQREGVLVVEEKASRKDGSPVYLVVNVTSLGVTEDGTRETLVAVRDITDRREAEAETQRRASQLASLNEIVQAATSSLDLDTVAGAILNVTAEVMGADGGIIILEGGPDQRRLTPVATVGEIDVMKALNEVESMGENVYEMIDDLTDSVILEAINTAPGTLAAAIEKVLHDVGVAQVLAMPLRSGEKRTGFIGLGSRREGVFDTGDKSFYDAAGGGIGVSIENALIYRELAAEHERLSLLYRSAQGISGELETRSLLTRTAEEAARAVGAKQAMVAVVQPGSDQLKWSASYNINLSKLKDIPLTLQSGIGSVVVENKRALLAPPEEELTPEMKSVLENDPMAEVLGVLYGAAVPLISGDKVLGVLVLRMDRGDSRLSNEDMLLLEALGRQAGVAIENAALYDETRRHLEALEEAHRELMALDRMKSDFVSTVSHELRSPLAVIEGFAKTIVEHFDEIDPDTERESVEIILKKAISLEGLIENILDMSRIEEGRFEISRETFELVALCDSVRSDLEAMEETTEVKMETEQPTIFVVADPEKTEVALGNLVRNAVKFSPQSSTVLIDVRVRGSMAELSVTDTGIGIPAEEQDRIFNRFYQVESGETRSFGGSGLGLYITKELVQAMGGQVKVDSEPGRGSVFTFTLPLAT